MSTTNINQFYTYNSPNNISTIRYRSNRNNMAWWLFGIFLFINYFNVSVIGHELGFFGRIRIFLAIGIYACLFRYYFFPKAVFDMLKSRLVALPVIILSYLIVSSAVVGEWNYFHPCLKFSFTLFSIMLWCYLLVRSKDDVRRLARIIALAVLGSSLLSLIVSMLYNPYGIVRLRSGIAGQYNDPNDTAYPLCWILPIVVNEIVTSSTKKRRYFWVVNFSLICIAIIATGSRGGAILGVTVLFFSFFSLRHDLKKIFKSLILSVFLSFIFVSFSPPDFLTTPLNRIMSLTEINNMNALQNFSSLDSRLPTQQAAIRVWLDHPVLGCGSGKFTTISARYFKNSGLYIGIQSHNTYLYILAENGFLGFSLFVLWLYLLWRFLWKKCRSPLGMIPVVAACAALLTNTVVGWHILYILSGVAAGLSKRIEFEKLSFGYKTAG